MSEWRTVRIGDLGRVITGKTPPSAQPELFIGGIPFITPSDMSDDARHIQTERYLSTAWDVKERLILPSRSICVVCIASIGKVCMTLKPSHTNQQINSIVVDPSAFDAHFVYYSMRQKTDELRTRAAGTATPIINKSVFSDLEINCPSLETQARIAGILGAYDDLIEVNQRRIAVLEEMARGLFEEWFVRFRFPGHESVPLVDTPNGPLPEGWNCKTLGQMGAVITGKTPSKANPAFYGADVPFVKIPDMHQSMFIWQTADSLSSQGASSQMSKTVPAGSLCVSCIATVGLVSITTKPSQTNQQINTLVPHDPHWREYLYFALESLKAHLQNLGSNGATMTNVNKQKFSSVQIAIPTDELMSHYHDFAGPLLDLIAKLTLANQHLAASRDLLLPRLMTGQLSVAAAEKELEIA
ncbi:restriction endonuclease subunit S [Asticcacaulis excentricus]|uniref:Type I restriction-modification system, restriction subunit R n=1 Tax=Asticcacaulis excentricus TaxID=78587 RepID=A0A3G9G4N2_9CAUL|nr:restriction endonuclease subunit S [Asticcacaulis excentricus]BBF80691.1 type I restriction-modification system, restriction subunit R [Asticcacaulis excentricus]